MPDDFFDRPEVVAAVAAVPANLQPVYKALIVAAGGDKYHDDVGTHVAQELQKASAQLALLHPRSTDDKPLSSAKPTGPTEQERQTAIRAEIDRLYGNGKPVMAMVALKYWNAIDRKLYGDKPADRQNEMPGKVPALGSIEKLQAANQVDQPAELEAVPAHLIVPRTFPDTPVRRLMRANVQTDKRSNIQQLLRDWIRSDRTARQTDNAVIRLAAQERRQIVAQQITNAGYKVPGAKQ